MKRYLGLLFALVLAFSLGMFAAPVPSPLVGEAEAQTSQTLHVSKWTEYAENPIFGQGVDSGPKAYYPSVLYDVNEFSGHGHSAKYKMWYGTSGAQTALATSGDGVNWTDQGVVMTNGYHAVVEYYPDGFTGANSGDNPSSATMYYRMWYWDESGIYYMEPEPIRYAESPDGFNWFNDQAITGNLFTGAPLWGEWNRTSYGPIDVLYNPTATNTGSNPFDYSFVMYFDATDLNFEEIGLGYSSDGRNWNLYGKVLPRGNDGGWLNTDDWDSCYASFGTVIKEAGGKWHMWYSGGTSGVNHGIGHATSSDGLEWTRDAGNPLLHVTDGVDWRNNRTYTPMVIEDGGIYKMWFSVKGDTGNYAIGYATADGPFPSIQAAINAASAGDTILVAAGTYTDNVTVNKQLTLTGDLSQPSNVVVDAGGSGSAIRLTYVDGCVLQGFKVQNGEYGIYLDHSDNNMLTSNIANSNTEYGIYLDYSDNNTLTSNIANSNTEYGIYLDGSNNDALTSNHVTGNNIGVKIQESVDASTISINFNNIYGNTNYGVDNTQGTGDVDAENNWWGDASGPYHSTTNPSGTGDTVSDNVDYDPWLGAEVVAQTVTNSTLDARTETDTEVEVDGSATVTVTEYADNPGTGFSGDIGRYIDVHIDDTSGVTEIEIRLYYTYAEIHGLAESSLRLYWWDGSDWTECSDSGVNPADTNGYSGYIWAKIRVDTIPDLDDLTGTPFGGGGRPPVVGGTVYPIDKASILMPWIGLAVALALAGVFIARLARRKVRG